MRLMEYFNLCDYCVYAPCICGNEPENCASYVQKNGIKLCADKYVLDEGHSYDISETDDGYDITFQLRRADDAKAD